MDDYKKLIIEMLDHATQKQLRLNNRYPLGTRINTGLSGDFLYP